MQVRICRKCGQSLDELLMLAFIQQMTRAMEPSFEICDDGTEHEFAPSETVVICNSNEEA